MQYHRVRFSGKAATAIAASLLSLGVSVVGSPAHAQLIFDNFDAAGAIATTRSSGDSPLANITVAGSTPIAAIAVRNDLSGAGNIKFLIFQDSTLVFSSAPKAFGDDGSGQSYKQSDPFSFTLLPGNTYFIGGIADVSGSWGVDSTGNTQNGITSHVANGNVQNFDSPTFIGTAGADTHIQLFSGTQSVAAPEPATLALLATGLLPVAGALIRRRRK